MRCVVIEANFRPVKTVSVKIKNRLGFQDGFQNQNSMSNSRGFV